MENDKLVATLSGVVERVNKLISVRPLKARLTGIHLITPPPNLNIFLVIINSSSLIDIWVKLETWLWAALEM